MMIVCYFAVLQALSCATVLLNLAVISIISIKVLCQLLVAEGWILFLANDEVTMIADDDDDDGWYSEPAVSCGIRTMVLQILETHYINC